MPTKCKSVNIDGAVLTTEALKEIESLQSFDNDAIDSKLEEITDYVFFLIQEAFSPEQVEKNNDVIALLGSLRYLLKCIKAPIESKDKN